MLIIDGHSHAGKDFFHGLTRIEDYVDLLKKNSITYGLSMPTPVPVEADTGRRYLIWEINNNKIHYYSEISDLVQNPYEIVNRLYYEKIKNSCYNNIFFVPLVHPILDDVDYLEKLVEDLDPVALKIHGIGSGIDPYKIPQSFSEFVRKHNLLLIVHTDYDDGKRDVRYDTLLMRQLNVPYRWADYLVNNQIRGVLNHGAAIDKETYTLVNNSPYLKIAIGPDAIIQYDKNRVYITESELIEEGYLGLLKKYISSDKLIFDIDFNWNTDPEKNNQLDLQFIPRIKEIWDTEDQKKIFALNLLNHCPKLDARLKK